jgi:hypothetical protein
VLKWLDTAAEPETPLRPLHNRPTLRLDKPFIRRAREGVSR